MDGGDEAVLGALAAGLAATSSRAPQRASSFRAIHAVAAGEALFSPAVARRLAGYVSATVGRLGRRRSPSLPRGTRGPGAGRAGPVERADHAFLGLSPKTVRNHVSNIFSKLPARDRAEAIVMAREAGMGGEAGGTP